MEQTPEIIVDEEVRDFDSDVRRPYYRMRGKPVTQEQALEIIRRTDSFFSTMFWELGEHHPDYIGTGNFNNWLIERNHYPFGYGWIHRDGTVGGNAITQKYPNAEEFIEEWSASLSAFPYLDLVIAVTRWNELPDELWEMNDDQRPDFESAEYDEEFLAAIEVGIYVHDGTVEIMSPERTRQKYQAYAALYEVADRDKYKSEYYDDRGIVQVTEEDLRKCIEAYGLDAEKSLQRVPEYIWKGSPL